MAKKIAAAPLVPNALEAQERPHVVRGVRAVHARIELEAGLECGVFDWDAQRLAVWPLNDKARLVCKRYAWVKARGLEHAGR